VIEYFGTERGRFAVEITGPAEAPPAVLIAGLGDDHASWEPVLPYLTSEYRCVSFDNRGIGLSPITPGPYRIPELAADAHAIHRALGLRPCIAIGSSMGGAVCQEWAIRHPGDVSGLVLSNTWGRSDAFLRVLFGHWGSLASEGRAGPLMDSLLLFSMSAAYLAARPQAVGEFPSSPLPDLDGFAAAASACLGHDALAGLRGVPQPALVLAGRDDILTRPALSAEIAQAMPAADLHLLDAGHMTFWEMPEQWGRTVARWLDGRRPA
jgi:pimeloyl-ACP methyl ester carboxylesterase